MKLGKNVKGDSSGRNPKCKKEHKSHKTGIVGRVRVVVREEERIDLQ